MGHKNEDTYKNIMSVDPKLDEAYLARILCIGEKERIGQVYISEVVESNTARIMRVSVHITGAKQNRVGKLFIKTAKSDSDNNPYHEMSMKEGLFYKFLGDCPNADVPVPRCFDAYVNKESHAFVIVLADVADHYKVPDDTDLANKDVWFSCAESLARLHAAFWNALQENGDEWAVRSEEDIEAEIRTNHEHLQVFLNRFQDSFDERTITIFNHAMTINDICIREHNRRTAAKSNITICNGDSHIYNFMLSKDRDNKPVMVDFQFWGPGLGTGDLAHLTRVNFPDAFKKGTQLELVKRYYDTLLKQGVEGYSWDTCINDYRMAVAAMVLIPVWQYCCFGLKYEEWIGDVKGLVDNYGYMRCEVECN